MDNTQKSNPLKTLFRKILSIRGMGQVITVSCGLIVMCFAFGFINPNFYKPENIVNLLRQIAPFLIIGIGQSYVLITGNIDLSIGSVVGMSCMISATLMVAGVNPWLAVLITLSCCILLGLLNGILVAKCKLPPFIATLGTMTIARGIAQLPNYNTDAIGADGFSNFFYYGAFVHIYNPFKEASERTYLPIYNTIFIAIILWIVFAFLLSKTRTGRHIYAIGSNIEAARLSGVNVVATTNKAYIISAFCAGVVGLITCATTGSGTMDAGTSYELYAVATSVIGGVSTLGGQGILLGTAIGSAIWGVLQNGLQFAGVPVAWRNIVIGTIVILSVLVDVIIRTGKPRKKSQKKDKISNS